MTFLEHKIEITEINVTGTNKVPLFNMFKDLLYI